jgi:hypothetical protein
MFNIPMPKPSGEILDEGVQNLMERLMRQKQFENEAQYRNAMLGVSQQKESRESQEQPYNFELLKAKIASEKALAKQREREPSGKFGTGTGDELQYHATVAKYNPDLSADQLREASDAYAEGKDSLSDGTKLAPITPTLQRALDRAFKSTTTSGLITQGVQSNQAHAELGVFDKAINDAIEPYGTVEWGYSPQQIKDAANVSDHTAQERLGKYMGAQQLLYDRAALTLKINALPPGVSLADEIVKLSNQSVNAKYPRQSAESRKIASKYVADTLTAGLKARNKYGIGAASATGNNKYNNSESSNNESEKMITLTNPETKETITIPLSEARNRGFKG